MPPSTTYREVATRDTADAATPSSGLARVMVAMAAAAVVCSLPYVVPGLERFRPWTPGDKVPFSMVGRTDSSGPVVAEASGGLEHDKALNKQERALLELDQKPAAPPVRPRVPVAPKEAAKTTPGKAAAPAQAPIVVPAAATAGVKVFIEDPKKSMATFYRALARTARREKGAVTRIGHWADSAVSYDGLTSVARRLLQRQYGDAGHGFILAARASRFYHHQGVRFTSRDWKRYRITHANAPDRRYGYGGVRARGDYKSAASFGTVSKGEVGRAVSRFEIFHLRGPGQGTLELRVDKQAPQLLSARADAWEDAVHVVKVEDGPHRLRLRVRKGRVSVYGVALERDGPGVVYDTLGLVGLFGKRFANLDPAHWQAQLRHRRPDLMMIMLGGNTLGFPSWSSARYAKDFGAMLDRFRQGRPEASCLVLGPLDHGEKHRGSIRTKPRLEPMNSIQRKMAHRKGCAFYSIFDAMGGEGTMGRWVRSKPRLVSGDLTHVSKSGAKVLGALLYRALMTGFKGHLQRETAR